MNEMSTGDILRGIVIILVVAQVMLVVIGIFIVRCLDQIGNKIERLVRQGESED